MQNIPGCILFGNDSGSFYLSDRVKCIQIKNFAYGSTTRVCHSNLEGVYLHKIEMVVPTESIRELCVTTINIIRQTQKGRY